MITHRAPSTQHGRHGLLLVGHGTRNEQGLAEFWTLAEHVTEIARDYLVQPCFLELAQPDIAMACNRLVARGVSRVTIAPVLLFAAGHAKRDIPELVNEALHGHEIDVDQASTLECHRRIVELSTRRFDEAISRHPPSRPGETLLLLVSRGNSDPEAQMKMSEFARLRSDPSRVASTQVCYAAVAKPTLGDALKMASESKYRRIVVQPHLLFQGEVLDQIASSVEQAAQAATDRQWIVTNHLGPSPEVAEAIVNLVQRRSETAAGDVAKRF